MSTDLRYDDPTNRVVCTFKDQISAEQAKHALVDFGFDEGQVHLLHDKTNAAKVDASAKWFADTDKELKKFKRELLDGCSVLSVPVKDCDCREKVHDLVKQRGAYHITHFGEWITEVMQ